MKKKWLFTYMISGTYQTFAEGETIEEARKEADAQFETMKEDTEELLNVIGDELYDVEEIK